MDPYELIEASLKFIENNVEEPLSLNDVAQYFNYSKFYYHRLFTAIMGIRFNDYVLSRRLNRAVKLIQMTDWNITTITNQLNFSTPSAFTRAFKKYYHLTPSELITKPTEIMTTDIPPLIRRPLKNINGDIVSNFSIIQLESFKVSGLVFQVDLAVDDYRLKITQHANQFLALLDPKLQSPGYVIFSECMPQSTTFNVIIGIDREFKLDLPYFFTVEVPDLLMASFNYTGNLLEMETVLQSDYARFLKITKQESGNADINMIQRFDNIHDLYQPYQLFVPIKANELDMELLA
ncbi:helix-turn-helix domain-containing protein [Fundicoccus culcitae]|uniref:AraC family transcriptional regulator n=1 Tax=Fundicoccus culcitae TaxID=2969821 RepID=A0ABY5P5V1_9LACT|nr:AraC family transcriptional regulator [Fundicoccus culcitae]UUX34119.1 AraC family transcriptional regulator [Fundicoccus culcitae]